MKRSTVNSQMNNLATLNMYRRQFLTLAENVFEFNGMPKFIDTAFLNKTLLRKGAIAFFEDEIMGFLALPFVNTSKLDVYGRPKTIEVFSMNGYHRKLNQGEFVIMYDNNGRYPIYLDIIQYAERYSMYTRVIDINISQQKTPRFWKTQTEKERSIKDLINNVDSFENVVLTYNNIDLDETSIVLSPAPYVADKINLDKDRIYNEFLRLIGIANLNFQKKERNIKDEIQAMQGGTVASRFSRYEPRKKACELINEKFGLNLEVKYYDGIPASYEEFEQKDDIMEVEEDV